MIVEKQQPEKFLIIISNSCIKHVRNCHYTRLYFLHCKLPLLLKFKTAFAEINLVPEVLNEYGL